MLHEFCVDKQSVYRLTRPNISPQEHNLCHELFLIFNIKHDSARLPNVLPEMCLEIDFSDEFSRILIFPEYQPYFYIFFKLGIWEESQRHPDSGACIHPGVRGVHTVV